MSLLARAGGLSGAIRRLINQPRQTLVSIYRLIRSRINASRLQKFEAPHRQAFFEAVLPRQEALAQTFAGLQGQRVRNRAVTSGEMVTRQGLHLWALIREHHLATVVETGVCNGLSSYVILSALATLQTNGKTARLTSIDLPEFSDESGSGLVWEGKGGAVVPAGLPVGWLVEDNQKDRWDLRLGRSIDLLAPCLEELAPIDLFIHDSEHSFENQLFEFRAAFQALRPGGYLFASDIQFSGAFSVFWRECGRQADVYFLDHSCAVVRRRD